MARERNFFPLHILLVQSNTQILLRHSPQLPGSIGTNSPKTKNSVPVIAGVAYMRVSYHSYHIQTILKQSKAQWVKSKTHISASCSHLSTFNNKSRLFCYPPGDVCLEYFVPTKIACVQLPSLLFLFLSNLCVEGMQHLIPNST